MRRTLIATVVALAMVGLASPPASAHAALADSNPTNGQRLEKVPELFSVTLNEEVASPAQIAVVRAAGDVVATEEAKVDGRMVSTRLSEIAGLASGGYSMSYRLVSADGHAVSGSVDFEIRKPEGAEAESTAPSADGDENAPSWDQVAEDAAAGGDLTLSAILVAAALVVMAILLIVVRRGVRSKKPTRHPDP